MGLLSIFGKSKEVASMPGADPITAVSNLASGILDRVIPDKTARDAAKAQLDTLKEQGELQADADRLKAELALNDTAGQNIRTETSSGDAVVRRARPMFLWMMTTAMFLNMVVPLINHAFHGTLQPIAIDPSMYDLFKIAFLGYCTARTVEKMKDKD